MLNKVGKQTLAILISALICIIIALGIVIGIVPSNPTKKAKGRKDLYLSDIQYEASQSKVGSGKITYDKDGAGNKISLKIEGAWYSFDKGVYAHAPSYVTYNIADYNYKYFTAYAGLNSTANSNTDGVIVYSNF